MTSEWIEREAGPWRDRARALQLRIRDRFRIAVDRQRHRRPESDWSVALRRWANRIRSFWKEPNMMDSTSSRHASSTSFRFYRKKVDKDLDGFDDPILVRLLQSLAVPIIGNACHVFMHGLNYVQVYGIEKLHRALLERPEGKPLITVSNHVAAIDDPFVIASLLPPTALLNAKNIRWTLCATDRCFKNPMMSAFFRCVKVLPASRGDGIYQKGMDIALSKLNKGGWVHIFPEGSRSRDRGRTIGPAKRGVGRLVMDADNIPMVVPFVHSGMQDIMPLGTKFPHIGKRVIVVIGDPINFDDLLPNKEDNTGHLSRGILYDQVSSRIGERLQELKVQADRLVLEQPLINQDYSYSIWQHADWEAFGMKNLLTSSESKPDASVKEQSEQPNNEMRDPPAETEVIPSVIGKGFYDEGGIVSRVRGYMNHPSELMGFAARGLFVNGTFLEESREKIPDLGLMNAWKEFFEGNVLPRWNCL